MIFSRMTVFATILVTLCVLTSIASITVSTKPRITHVNNQKPTSFYVNWEPPREINGKLMGYELQWICNEDVKSRFITGYLIRGMMAFISDLKPYTLYKVQVAAISNESRGEFSDQFPVLTDVAAPGTPRNLNVTELRPHSVHLSWEKPMVYYRAIDIYLIKGIDHHRGRVIETTVGGDMTRHTLPNLTRYARYHFQVAAITRSIFSSEKWVGDFTDTFVIILRALPALPDLSYNGDNFIIYVGVGVSAGGIIIVVIVIIIIIRKRKTHKASVKQSRHGNTELNLIQTTDHHMNSGGYNTIDADPNAGYITVVADPGYLTPVSDPGYITPVSDPGYSTPVSDPGYLTPVADPGYITPDSQEELYTNATNNLDQDVPQTDHDGYLLPAENSNNIRTNSNNLQKYNIDEASPRGRSSVPHN